MDVADMEVLDGVLETPLMTEPSRQLELEHDDIADIDATDNPDRRISGPRARLPSRIKIGEFTMSRMAMLSMVTSSRIAPSTLSSASPPQ